MTTSPPDASFHELAAEFVQLLRSGECANVEEFAARYPEHRALIESEFAGIQLAESFGSPLSTPKQLKSVGRYIIEEEIGRGGMGIVYAARHPTLGTELAIKIVPLAKIQGRDAERRFKAEAQACAAMDHPHIVPVFDYGTTDEFAFLAMRRIRGASLEKIIRYRDGRQASEQDDLLDWGKIAEIGRQIAEALQYSHEQGVLHRDIKPANIILDERGRVLVSDFGLAKINESQTDRRLTKTGDIVGTLRYMAPERLLGISNPSTDVFGLGLTMYELATGERVWDSLDDHQIATRESLSLPDLRELLPEMPESLAQIIMKASSFQSEERYQTAEELSLVLTRFLDGHELPDRRRARNSKRARWKRKDVVYSTAVGGVALLGLAAFEIHELRSKSEMTPQTVLKAIDNTESKQEFIGHLMLSTLQMATSEDRRDREVFTDLADVFMDATLEATTTSAEERENVHKTYSAIRDAVRENGLSSIHETLTPEFVLAKRYRDHRATLERKVVNSQLTNEYQRKVLQILEGVDGILSREKEPAGLVPLLEHADRFPSYEGASQESIVRLWADVLESLWMKAKAANP